MGRGEPGRAKPWREVRKEEGGEEKEGKEVRKGEGGEGKGGGGGLLEHRTHLCIRSTHLGRWWVWCVGRREPVVGASGV